MAGIDWETVEGTAEALYRAAGLEEDAAPLELAEGLGLRVVVAHGASLPGLAALCRVGREWRVYLRAKLDESREGWAIAHEIAEWSLMRNGYAGGDVEALANALAASIVAPRSRFLRLHRQADGSTARVAEQLNASESLVALRLGEVTGEPLALVAPAVVRTRGREWSWPTSSELRSIAQGSMATPGLKKSPLRDDPRRFLIRVA